MSLAATSAPDRATFRVRCDRDAAPEETASSSDESTDDDDDVATAICVGAALRPSPEIPEETASSSSDEDENVVGSRLARTCPIVNGLPWSADVDAAKMSRIRVVPYPSSGIPSSFSSNFGRRDRHGDVWITGPPSVPEEASSAVDALLRCVDRIVRLRSKLGEASTPLDAKLSPPDFV